MLNRKIDLPDLSTCPKCGDGVPDETIYSCPECKKVMCSFCLGIHMNMKHME